MGILSKVEPKMVRYGIGGNTDKGKHDKEGRVLTLEFDTFFLVSVYVPHSGMELKRLSYRVDEWDKDFQ